MQGLAGTDQVSSFATSGTASGELLISNTTTTTGTSAGTNSLYQIFDINAGLDPRRDHDADEAGDGDDALRGRHGDRPSRRPSAASRTSPSTSTATSPRAPRGGPRHHDRRDDRRHRRHPALRRQPLRVGPGHRAGRPGDLGRDPGRPVRRPPRRAPRPSRPRIAVPVQGPGPVGVQVLPDGRSARSSPTGTRPAAATSAAGSSASTPTASVTEFATNFNTSQFQNSQSFIDSSLSITFSADGTTLYAADNDGIWQFKTVTSLAGSTVRLDHRPERPADPGRPLRGPEQRRGRRRHRRRRNVPELPGPCRHGPERPLQRRGQPRHRPGAVDHDHDSGRRRDDRRASPTATAPRWPAWSPSSSPRRRSSRSTSSPRPPTPSTARPPARRHHELPRRSTSPEALYNGLKYTADHPFVADPVRPNKQDRVVAATLGFGTTQTFNSEAGALKKFPQVTTRAEEPAPPPPHRWGSPPSPRPASSGRSPPSTSGTTHDHRHPGQPQRHQPAGRLQRGDLGHGHLSLPDPARPTTTPASNFAGILGRFAVPFLLGGTTTTTTGSSGDGASDDRHRRAGGRPTGRSSRTSCSARPTATSPPTSPPRPWTSRPSAATSP